jgi:hypothetical protein
MNCLSSLATNIYNESSIDLIIFLLHIARISSNSNFPSKKINNLRKNEKSSPFLFEYFYFINRDKGNIYPIIKGVNNKSFLNKIKISRIGILKKIRILYKS